MRFAAPPAMLVPIAACGLVATTLVGCRLELGYRDPQWQCAACVDGGSSDDDDDGGDGDDDDDDDDSGDDDGGEPDAGEIGETPYALAVLADVPELYLRFDESSGPVVFDASDNDNHGVLSGGTLREPTGAFASSGRALWFDGSDDVVAVSDEYDLMLNSDFTIEFWIRLDPTLIHDFPGILRRGSTSEGYFVYYSAATPRPVFKRGGAVFEAADAAADLSTTAYRHIAVTYEEDLGRFRWYADGAEVFATTGIDLSYSGDDATLFVGRGEDHGRIYLDEFAIYTRELTPEQIAWHYTVANTP